MKTAEEKAFPEVAGFAKEFYPDIEALYFLNGKIWPEHKHWQFICLGTLLPKDMADKVSSQLGDFCNGEGESFSDFLASSLGCSDISLYNLRDFPTLPLRFFDDLEANLITPHIFEGKETAIEEWLEELRTFPLKSILSLGVSGMLKVFPKAEKIQEKIERAGKYKEIPQFLDPKNIETELKRVNEILLSLDRELDGKTKPPTQTHPVS